MKTMIARLCAFAAAAAAVVSAALGTSCEKDETQEKICLHSR